jgi:hypothetical protein
MRALLGGFLLAFLYVPKWKLLSVFNVILFYALQTVGLGEAMTALKIIGLIIGFLGVPAVSAGVKK